MFYLGCWSLDVAHSSTNASSSHSPAVTKTLQISRFQSLRICPQLCLFSSISSQRCAFRRLIPPTCCAVVLSSVMMLFRSIQFSLRRIAILFLLSVAALVLYLALAITHATTTATDVSDFVKKLLPAGNCLCQSSTVFDCRLSGLDLLRCSNGIPSDSMPDPNRGGWKYQHERDSINFGLSSEQCDIAFPGLFDEVHRAVDFRRDQGSNISLADLDAIEAGRGTTRALIANGKLRVLGAMHPDEIQRKKGLAILYSINRAIAVDGRATPDTEFIFSIDDMVENPSQPIWTVARRSQDHNLWLMPDFGYWSWDVQDLGTLTDVTEQIIMNEALTEWATKHQKLVWRGQLQMLPKLRRALLDASRGKTWSEVEALIPDLSPENYISAADQCRYMFIAHAEGKVYLPELLY